MNNKVLVVAPHPDDETLGVGGTLLKHLENGSQLYWLLMTTVDSHPNYTKAFQAARLEQIKRVGESYQMQSTFQLPFLAAELDRYPLSDVVSAVQGIIKKLEPNILYLPFSHDAHSDHRITFEATFSCCKTFRNPSINEVLMYETLSETNFSSVSYPAFQPNVFVNVSNTFDKKLRILDLYETELRDHPFPRSKESINALGLLRGTQGNAHFAEAFMQLKRLC
jgi:LmbE family N-acetylglucosaminyl deacetylase